jgi:hypothetical protein
VSGPTAAQGTLVLNSNGSFTFTPAANFNGPVSFTYLASDGIANSNTAVVTITLNPVNDPPVVTNPGSQANSENDNVSLQIAASDVDGDTLSYSASGLPPGLSINSSTGLINGTIGFGAAANSPYNVTVTANDGHGGITNAPVTWTVIAGIAFRSASFARNGGATTLVIAKPASLVAGNVMLASIDTRGTTVITAPVGWVTIADNANGTAMRKTTYYKIAGASEPSTYTWSFSSAVPAAGGIVAYRGVDQTNPIDAANGQSNASSTSITAPSISTTVPNAMLLGFFGTAINATIAPPTGMVERGEIAITSGNTKIATEISDAILAATGPTGVRIAVADRAASNIGQVVALRPVTPPSTTSPLAPTNLSATPGDRQISLNWNASSGASSYNIKRSSVSGGPYTTIASMTSTSYVDTNLTNGVTYYYVVTAVNATGESPDSAQVSAVPQAPPPPPPASPSGLSATSISPSQINLVWTDNSNNEDGFKIERSTNGTTFTQIATVGPSITTFSNTGLSKNTTYYYRVSSYGSGGNSAYSNTASARTPNR